MSSEPAGGVVNPAPAEPVEAFVAELRHWREVSGNSQKALARAVGYTPSYVSKVECCALVPSLSFAESADRHMNAGRALIRRWKDMRRRWPRFPWNVTGIRRRPPPMKSGRSAVRPRP